MFFGFVDGIIYFGATYSNDTVTGLTEACTLRYFVDQLLNSLYALVESAVTP